MFLFMFPYSLIPLLSRHLPSFILPSTPLLPYPLPLRGLLQGMHTGTWFLIGSLVCRSHCSCRHLLSLQRRLGQDNVISKDLKDSFLHKYIYFYFFALIYIIRKHCFPDLFHRVKDRNLLVETTGTVRHMILMTKKMMILVLDLRS